MYPASPDKHICVSLGSLSVSIDKDAPELPLVLVTVAILPLHFQHHSVGLPYSPPPFAHIVQIIALSPQ